MEIVMIKVKEIIPHPKNLRKDPGDLTELTESIRKNGIMQNLTVVPYKGRFGKYMALIGHRRLLAAKAAGLEEVPAKIEENLTEGEQVAIMLEENMQRDDLTPIEQAYGFQMVLDLGGTEEMLMEKTGFSKQTIRHRLQIAKLDKRILDRHEKGESWQLSMKDLIELEKIDDVKERNHLLRTSKDSLDMTRQISLYLLKKKRRENAEAYIIMFEEKGIKKAPEELIKNKWSGKYERVKQFDLDADPEKITLKTTGKMYYIPPNQAYDVYIEVYQKRENEKEKTEEEKARAEKEREEKKKKEHLKEIGKRIETEREDFVKGILDGKYGKPDGDILRKLVNISLCLTVGMYMSSVREWFIGKYEYQATEEEERTAREKAGALEEEDILVIINEKGCRYSMANICNWRREYNGEAAEKVKKWHEMLGLWGFRIDDEEEQQFLDGTHEFFWKEEKNDEADEE